MPPRLVFIHGFGFDRTFFAKLGKELSQFQQTHLDLGFFNEKSGHFGEELKMLKASEGGQILVGHSLGFALGIERIQDWEGWIAINGFHRFTKSGESDGCVRRGALVKMQRRLQKDAVSCVKDFYREAGLPDDVPLPCNQHNLREGLNSLASIDTATKLAALDRPGLVLGSEKDWLVPSLHTRSLAKYAEGNLAIHPEGGHLLPITHASWCALHIDPFVKKIFVQRNVV